jgi:hypothetical protein
MEKCRCASLLRCFKPNSIVFYRCTVLNHSPSCHCLEGMTGNPLVSCHRKPDLMYLPPPKSPCESNPCGSNAICRESNGVGSCTCKEYYYGDPYVACTPECLTSSDCPLNKACNSQVLRCENPCLKRDVCGINAVCEVVSHNAVCYCRNGLTGDPFIKCFADDSKAAN